MFRKSLILTLIMAFTFPLISFADEGMWLPLLLHKREKDMKSKGMRISAKDIYDVNNSSLKDAVMLFAGGCTGEFVSNQGLLLTNHHCGYSFIVSQSSVERDYLTNGFWSNNKEEELPCPGLSISLLVYMEDVTEKVLEGVNDKMTESERVKVIDENIKKIKEKATENNHYSAIVKPFFYGNQYFLYVNETFTDVRLVGAPPSNIGKFGGDTDNWMWPRHTGDFSVFRVYANKDNKPAKYSKDNIPYAPKKFLKINTKGLKEGDFTFVFGYPGTTEQFLTSFAVDRIMNYEDPARIKLRTERLKIYNQAMNSSPAQRLRYASGVAGIANGWKKWIGEVKGLKRMNAVERKQIFEKEFMLWANSNAERKEKYGYLMDKFKVLYTSNSNIEMSYLYLTEAVLASDLMRNARGILGIIAKIERNAEAIDKDKKLFMGKMDDYFANDYENHKKVDRDIFIETMNIFYNDFAKSNYAWVKERVDTKFKGIAKDYFANIYDNSFLSDKVKTEKAIKKFNAKKLEKDPAIELLSFIWNDVINKKMPLLTEINEKTDSLYRIYVKGIMEMDTKKDFYPDANLTLRVAYGNVKPYKPKDAVEYSTHTKINGIMEKENPDIYDYVVESKLKELYNKKDYAPYSDENGDMPVAFIASNHTTGGNSGSPVLDGDGNLVGINFDRNWEGTMSDIIYDPDQCRNISLDIRYTLFIIDKFAGAKNIISEMTILN